MEHAEPPGREVTLAGERIDDEPEVVCGEGHGHGVDREVPPVEVVVERSVLDGRQGARRVVRLSPRCGNVDSLAVSVEDDRCAETVVDADAPLEPHGQCLRPPDGIAFDRDVDVEALLAEQDVSHGAADEEHAVDRDVRLLDGAEHRREPRELVQLLRDVLDDGHAGDCALGAARRPRRYSPASAIASISTSAPDGRAATSIVARAGGWSPTWRAYTSFIPPKSPRSWR